MSDGLWQTFKDRASATVASPIVALTCLIPGATQTIEKPVEDIIDVATMVTGGTLADENNGSGILTDAARKIGLDDQQFKGKGRLEDACEGGRFIGATAASIFFGGPIKKVADKLIVDRAKLALKNKFRKESTPPSPAAKTAAGKIKDWTLNKAAEFGYGTVIPATGGAMVDVGKEIYREDHKQEPGPTPP